MNHTNRQDLWKQGNAVIDAWFGCCWKDKYVFLLNSLEDLTDYRRFVADSHSVQA